MTWVSIRARQLQRANQWRIVGGHVMQKFQSAPANYSGRIEAPHSPHRSSPVFQSAPANYSGRIIPKAAALRAGVLFQSAPANYSGRITTLLGAFEITIGFQSAPANYSGRIARYPLCRCGTHRCFNPRPPITAGESLPRGRGKPRCRCFNPRPPITAGES